MKAQTSPLCDQLNLRSFIDDFSELLKKHSTANIKNRRDFLSKLIEYIPPIKLEASEKKPREIESGIDAYYTVSSMDFERWFSGNIRTSKLEPLFTRIVNGSLEMELHSFFENEIVSHVTDTCVYKTLFEKASPMFWFESEHEELCDYFSGNSYTSFLVCILKHGATFPDRIPYLTAQRLYNQALSYDYDVPIRYYLMQQAADLGHVGAGIEFANYLCKIEDYNNITDNERIKNEKGIEYFLGIFNTVSIWNILFFIQNHYLNETFSKKIIKETRKKIDIDEKLNNLKAKYRILYQNIDLSPLDEEMLFVFNMHFILAFDLEYKYPKSANNLGNIVLKYGLSFKAPDNLNFNSDKLAAILREYAVGNSELAGISNLLKQNIKSINLGSTKLSEWDHKYLDNISQVLISSGWSSCYFDRARLLEALDFNLNGVQYTSDDISNLYYKEIELRESRIPYYEDTRDVVSKCHLAIAKFSSDFSQKEEHLKLSIDGGNPSAALLLIEEYIKMYNETGKKVFLINADMVLSTAEAGNLFDENSEEYKALKDLNDRVSSLK